MILIVDDKQENLFSLKALLTINGYDVDSANSGEGALKKILKTDYALIILDVQMPEMDGYEVAENIKGYSKSKNIPIIFLSAVNIDKRFITRGYASGGVDYVTKPFDPDLLLLKVKTFYKLYNQTRQLNKIQNSLNEEIARRTAAQKELEDINLLLEERVLKRTEELIKTNGELSFSNVELQQYAFLASHDLQEPLRKILTFLRLIEDRYMTQIPDAQKYFDKIIKSAERMRVLIDDLLKYSKLSTGSDFVNTNLNEILSEAISDLEAQVEETHAHILTTEIPNAEVIPGQFRQIFQNIISNGIKFSKKDIPAEIVIGGSLVREKEFDSPEDEHGKFIRITISDKGIGFNEKYLEKIFAIFQRLHTRDEIEGTGIGLAIVKKIIEKHNGIITAKSIEGEGTKFMIVFPVKQNAETLIEKN